MQTRHKIGILGATGVIGQRFIQLLENHPWFEITWLAASDKSSGKTYGEATKWKLETPLPARIAEMMVSPASPEGAPKVIFAALDSDIARELEPKFAAAGCAVISNSSAFRMQADVPLVIPEVNADHLDLLETQGWRKQSGGYIVTNPNCSAIGLVLALKPLADRFGLESVFVSTMQAVSGAGYPGVASLDILGNVVPYIKSEEEKLEEETLKLLGKLSGNGRETTERPRHRALQPGSGRRRPHRECEHQVGDPSHAGRNPCRLERICAAGQLCAAHRPRPADRVGLRGRPAATSAGPHARQGNGRYRRPPAPMFPA